MASPDPTELRGHSLSITFKLRQRTRHSLL